MSTFLQGFGLCLYPDIQNLYLNVADGFIILNRQIQWQFDKIDHRIF